MQIMGKIFSGAMRGNSLVDLYYARLAGILGFQPFRGTMDVKLEKGIDIASCATKALDHKLMDGSHIVYAYLAPVTIIVEEQEYKCWALQQAEGAYSADIVELVAADKLKEKFALDDGDTIVLEFTKVEKPLTFMQKFVKKTSTSVRQVGKKK